MGPDDLKDLFRASKAASTLEQRAEEVAEALGYGTDHISLPDLPTDEEGFDLAAHGDKEIQVSWYQRCGRGCCGEDEYRSFPLKYLWMSRDEIRADRDRRVQAKKEQEAEEERLEKLQEAEEAVARAELYVLTAQQQAEDSLRYARSQLAALQGT